MLDAGKSVCGPGETPKEIERFLHMLLSQVGRWGKVVHHAVLAECPAHYADPGRLPEAIEAALLAGGIRRLYLHQGTAIEKLCRGEHVVVATPTASGKSLVYNTAVAEVLLARPQQRELYLFPTKALSRDQLGTVGGFLASLGNDPPLGAAIPRWMSRIPR